MILLYIDPGAGSLVIQALIATVVSVPFFFRSTIRNAIRRLRGESDPTGSDSKMTSDEK